MTFRAALAVLLLARASGTPAHGQATNAQLAKATDAITPRLIELRHDLHQHPELSNRETRTAEIVALELNRLGLEVTTGVAKTGVIGVLRGARPGRTVGVRADMDALPVTEATDVPYRSMAKATYLDRETGVSHACGHDMHVTTALGVAEVLAGMRGSLAGTVVFIFQPAEEGAPVGEEGGAELMVKEGVLSRWRPDVMLAFHTNGDAPGELGDFERLGVISYTPGPQYASSTTWQAKVIGRQAHGASPHLAVDAIVTASQVVMALQTIVSRTVPPLDDAVVTVGVLRAGERHNIVAGSAESRRHDPDVRRFIDCDDSQPDEDHLRRHHRGSRCDLRTAIHRLESRHGERHVAVTPLRHGPGGRGGQGQRAGGPA